MRDEFQNIVARRATEPGFAVSILSGAGLPDLGDQKKRLSVELSEPEIATIYMCLGLVMSMPPEFEAVWRHYGEHVEQLYKKLQTESGNVLTA